MRKKYSAALQSEIFYFNSKKNIAPPPPFKLNGRSLTPEIKVITKTFTSASIIDLLLSVTNGILSTKLYDKRDVDFHFVNFPYIRSNIPESPAYGVYTSQLLRYARACSSYGDCIHRGGLLTKKLADHSYTLEKLKIYFRKFYGRYNDLLKH